MVASFQTVIQKYKRHPHPEKRSGGSLGSGYNPPVKLEEIQQRAMELTDSDRATLAAELLTSLPSILVDEDEGVAEARRRSRELKEDPSTGCSWDEIKRTLGR